MTRRWPWMAVFVVLAAYAYGADGDQPVDTRDGGAGAAGARGTDDLWAQFDVAPETPTGKPLARHGANRTAQANGDDPSTKKDAGWLRTTLALGAVVGLILLLAWGYRLIATNGRLPLAMRPRGTALEVVARTTLAPRHSLALVRLGPRLVLLGMSPDGVRRLDVIDDPELTARLLGDVARQRPESATAAFAECLEREAHEPEADDDDALPETRLAPPPDRLSEVRRTLSGALERLRARATGT